MSISSRHKKKNGLSKKKRVRKNNGGSRKKNKKDTKRIRIKGIGKKGKSKKATQVRFQVMRGGGGDDPNGSAANVVRETVPVKNGANALVKAGLTAFKM